MSTQTFVLPDVGEGLTEAEIVQWRVGPGDSVAVNDVLVEIETAKSLVELPSPFAGTVGELLAAEGATVNVGTAIITIASTTDAAPPATVGQSEHGQPAEPAEGEGAVLVGYGTGGQVQSRRRKAAVPAAERVAASVGIIAKPPIRKLARDLGVELSAVAPSGPAGEVTREDVVRHASQASVFRNIETPEWGDVREETISVAAPAAAARSTPGPAEVAPSTPAPDAAGREETIAVK
ncbi:MAG TPA: biotin/lipoyl-containing protein, partial [Agromyces sp.]